MKFSILTHAFLVSFCFSIFSAAATDSEKCAPVEFAQREIICLAANAGSFSAADRAATAQKKLETLATGSDYDATKFQIVQNTSNIQIIYDQRPIISIFAADLPAEFENPLEFAPIVQSRLIDAIKAYRLSRDPEKLLFSALYAVLATLVFIILITITKKIVARLHLVISSFKNHCIQYFKIQSFQILNADRVEMILKSILGLLSLFIYLVMTYFYVSIVFSFFPWTEHLAPKLINYILNPLIEVLKAIFGFLPNIFFIFAISLATRYILKLIKFFFNEIEAGNLQFQGFYQEWAQPTYKLVQLLIFAFALVMIFPYLPGAGSEAFQGISVFLGLLISLGSSSAISNMVAGSVITYMRPFKVGDRVKIGDTTGDVVEKSLLVTRIKTIKQVEITIPNSMVLSGHVINYSRMAESEGLILNSTVTIGYDVPWVNVHEALIKAALQTPLIDRQIQPFVLQTALGDFAVSYEINAYTRHPQKMATTYSELHKNIQDCFNQAGIEIMSPHYFSLRDGNTVTIPESQRPKDYQSPSFRIRTD